MQVRQCTRRERKPCRSMLGLTSMEYEYSCSGVELSDISLIGKLIFTNPEMFEIPSPKPIWLKLSYITVYTYDKCRYTYNYI